MKLPIMGQNCHGQIGCKHNVVRCNFVDKTAFKIINMNTDLIEYVPKIIVKKEVRVKFKHVDPVFNSINTFPLAETKVLANTQNNSILSVYCCKIIH